MWPWQKPSQTGRKEERTGDSSVLGRAEIAPSAEEMKFSSVTWFSYFVLLSPICSPQAMYVSSWFLPQNKATSFPGVYNPVHALDPFVLNTVLCQ